MESEGKMWKREAMFWRNQAEEKDRELGELRNVLLHKEQRISELSDDQLAIHAANAKIQSLEADLQRLTETHAHRHTPQSPQSYESRSRETSTRPRSASTSDRLGRLESCLENMMQLYNATAITKRERK